jgi:predicted signal transduction protein with EAL and GGDEF domain
VVRSGGLERENGALAVPLRARGRVIGVLELSGGSLGEELGRALTALGHQVGVLVASARDEARLRHQALHDPLTGLPNRALFEDRLELGLRRLPRRGARLVLLFLDFDAFKAINDAYGHATGDEALRAAREERRRRARVGRPGDVPRQGRGPGRYAIGEC